MSQETRPEAAKGSARAVRKPRVRLAPSQKYEVFTAVLTNAATQRELAEKYHIDRSTIQGICRTAKQGAISALTALRHSAWFGCPFLTGLGGWR